MMRAANPSTIGANISRSGSNKLTEPGNAVPTCGIRTSQLQCRQLPSKNSGSPVELTQPVRAFGVFIKTAEVRLRSACKLSQMFVGADALFRLESLELHKPIS